MALTAVRKSDIVKKFQRGTADTGSAEVQIALLTADIDQLTEHAQQFKKDFLSRRGLLNKVGQRSKLLKYLKKVDTSRFLALVKELNIRY
ncbi:MAG: hypothetical protein ACD_44C00432G0006 [uncultured bacterium]|nr:MAG: hypothetical protein ACD_44C00432G0006 [uncultured bacterium]OGT15357.1 MAG: 30S ribosomal protein S15 [Gammaproteobacteria bacterium RIFCSPHIGHO2_02_FULL_38_33]OGT24023.1 MAG: 30S ribosomal protein S15 [Gammaproteobacteria bacterium RIFCSPHIGHO2_12_38_15]OGT69245.1 MAG: 30S ribosomal protein S15 [Gammaproteobacteria bacterium RIFCSPLOWO2_02_FULL_38_11]OGT75214.1 MAG: 30S ribosomal protein S15 [Gammaproteobacteria bacterium RIFCSPLOWO2_12_FULL_38_14]